MLIKITYIWPLRLTVNVSYPKFCTMFFYQWLSMITSTKCCPFPSLKWQCSAVLGRFAVCVCDYFVSLQFNNLCSHFLPCFMQIPNTYTHTHTCTHSICFLVHSLKNVLFDNIKTLERKQFCIFPLSYFYVTICPFICSFTRYVLSSYSIPWGKL